MKCDILVSPNFALSNTSCTAYAEDVRKLLKQILKVPYVITAEDITRTPYVERELMLIKVVCPRAGRGGAVQVDKE